MIPESVHLVGTVGLDTAEEVFHTCGRALGRRLARIPDGEVGGRRLWISWQYPLLFSNPWLRPDPAGRKRPTTGFAILALAEGAFPYQLKFGELGYAREARASYQDFIEARRRGDIAPGTRFQVCLPTPFTVISSYCAPDDEPAIEAAYEKAMLREVEALCRSIPHQDLCIQWDVCNEMILWDGANWEKVSWVRPTRDELLERMRRICKPVPADVELGIHLCYGDFGGRHFADPTDAGRMVELANALVRTIRHPLAYIHMPVPLSRTEERFFEPLANLSLTRGTEVYLGLVHAADGVDGVRRRVALAEKYLPKFGIATECGFARARTDDTVKKLIAIHAEASREA